MALARHLRDGAHQDVSSGGTSNIGESGKTAGHSGSPTHQIPQTRRGHAIPLDRRPTDDDGRRNVKSLQSETHETENDAGPIRQPKTPRESGSGATFQRGCQRGFQQRKPGFQLQSLRRHGTRNLRQRTQVHAKKSETLDRQDQISFRHAVERQRRTRLQAESGPR